MCIYTNLSILRCKTTLNPNTLLRYINEQKNSNFWWLFCCCCCCCWEICTGRMLFDAFLVHILHVYIIDIYITPHRSCKCQPQHRPICINPITKCIVHYKALCEVYLCWKLSNLNFQELHPYFHIKESTQENCYNNCHCWQSIDRHVVNQVGVVCDTARSGNVPCCIQNDLSLCRKREGQNYDNQNIRSSFISSCKVNNIRMRFIIMW